MKLLLVANTAFKLFNFRLGLIRALVADGHDLVAAAPPDDYTPALRALGVRVVDLPMDATGTSPLDEAKLLLRILNLIRQERPDGVLGYTVKPNIYGALSARLMGIPFIPNVTGLGTAFGRPGPLASVVKALYRTAFASCPTVFFQNPEDRALFLAADLVRAEQAAVLPGSGVDLAAFAARPLPGRHRALTFLLVARMLRDKGVLEFAAAARLLAPAFPDARFLLLGPEGAGKADGLLAPDLAALTADGAVRYLGVVQDVRPILAQADCVVLPSYYREGTPRALLEGAAMGRPVITTDMPGCRDVVEDGVSGYLCRAQDVEDLAQAMRRILLLDDAARARMGRAARARMEARFDEGYVIRAYRAALAGMTAPAPRPSKLRWARQVGGRLRRTLGSGG